MAGRLRPIQLSPFECQSSFGGLVAGRHNLDLQDMRRVLDMKLWTEESDILPQVGFSEHLGYMAKYEWAGGQYEERCAAPTEPVSWLSTRALAKEFRKAWLAAHERAVTGKTETRAKEDDVADRDFVRAILCGVSDAFCDGINSGFYINSYTTKPGPGLAGMLEELRKGIERLELEREERNQERSRAQQAAQDAGEHIPGRRGIMFAETMKTLTRLSSSYRRCHWKSAAELIFPLLYEHLTFASHRTWKLFVKKAIFFLCHCVAETVW